MTRCKVGDLVMICKTAPEYQQHLGRLGTITAQTFAFRHVTDLPVWELDIEDEDGNTLASHDDCLRPIRPGDMSDEAPTEVIKKLTEPA